MKEEEKEKCNEGEVVGSVASLDVKRLGGEEVIKNIFGEPRSKCGRRDAEDVKFRSADVVEAGSRRSAEVVEAGSRWTWRGSA